ncbi:MAG: hypothetical protein KAS32_06925 [Candidatus Peribacteraceae bacterium]|nr:hypothetical protein [Candidatus Peribacteraceae bacterium]
MSEKTSEKKEETGSSTLETMVGPTKFNLIPGLALEDKMTIKTQRRLERQFKIPIARIFPGELKIKGRKLEKWAGVDFTFIDNMVPLLTIMAQQVDPTVTEDYIESRMDDPEVSQALDNKLEEFFATVKEAGQSKNSQKSKTKKKDILNKK